MNVKLILTLSLVLGLLPLFAQSNRVVVQEDPSGMKLLVDGKPFMVNGVNWDYVPRGTNITDPGIWVESDEIIKAALDAEMALLRNMGVNAIRTYNLPPKWIQYIYENYGIYTMLNITFGAYGLSINGAWIPQTDYADPATHKVLMQEAITMANTYKDTPGLLLYMIGNENNYHLSWTTAETEDIPIEGSQDPNKIAAAKALYKAFNDATKEVKAIDQKHPVAICNGDLLYLDIVAQECPDVDIYGTNMYRGVSFGDAFERVKKEYGKPVLFAEFGADAFNAAKNEEDQQLQAFYDVWNWRDIYENAAGMGKAGNSLGGFTFQFSDGWWKYKQTEDFNVHNNNASWHNGGYSDYDTPGQNNMNEEWFGICAKGPTNEKGLYTLYPRAAYYALKEVHEFNPYGPGSSMSALQDHFSRIQIMDATLRARGDKAAMETESIKKLSISRMTAVLSTFNTGGSLITTPDDPQAGSTTFPNQLGFDHMQSFFVGVEANPTANFRANVDFNILGNVAQNPIDQIFYENRGRPVDVNTNNGNVRVESVNRVAVYQANYQWNHEYFDMKGFYRTGHYHWAYEGDFFNLYPEANYGPNIDIYNGIAPFGFEVNGKKKFKNFKMAFGPQLWWGANPAFLMKYSGSLGKFGVNAVFHEDIDQLGLTESSFAIPQPRTRRLGLHIDRQFGNFKVDAGALWGGQPLQGREFQVVREIDGRETAYKTEIEGKDNFGGKIKLTYQKGVFNWYAQSAVMGLVANGGFDQTVTFTGWRLKDSGSGNQYNFLTGFTYTLGNLQIAPNFLWQRPMEGPVTAESGAAARPRNILTDPFVVRGNREQVAGEILFTYDPTPGTWMYSWDSDRSEDAKFALSAGVVYRHLPTTQDAAIGILPDGRTVFAFPGAAPAQDLWEVHTRLVAKTSKDFGFIVNAYAGDAQANGSDPRLVSRFGMDGRAIYKQLKLNSFIKFNDWGPYDYHRDFNLTFPMQLMADVSLSLGKPDWFDMPDTRIGIRGTYRTLNEFSPRYAPTYVLDAAGDLVPDPTAIGFPNGNEWEIRTYVFINIGK